MALADRDYYGEPEPSGGTSRLTPMVKILLIANISIFVLDYLILAPSMKYAPLAFHGAFRISEGIFGFQLWQLISFQFMHGGFMHILFNSIGLFIFGPWIERYFGPKKFVYYYLICGAAGALFYTLLASIGIIPCHVMTPYGAIEKQLVGASAGIYGCVIGVAVLAPHMKVQLFFPPVVLTMRQLSLAILAIAAVFIAFDLQNAGGEAGHMGGAIAGYILMRLIPRFGRNSHRRVRPNRYSQRYESKLSPRSSVDIDEVNEIDTILDKVSKNGFQSLTDEEKSALRRAAGEREP